MHAPIKEAWVDNLLSDRFKQGTGRLRYFSVADEQYEHCCLGVLCEMAVEAGIVRRADEPDEDGSFAYIAVDNISDTDAEILPEAVVKWAGLDKKRPGLELRYEEIGEEPGVPEMAFTLRDLDELNDNGFTFEQIAVLIKNHL